MLNLLNNIECFNYKRIVVNDLNENIINFYLLLKDDVEFVVKNITKIEKKYNNYDNLSKKEEYYYQIREKFNCQKAKINAVYFLFLMKAGFNGVYRENLNGKFNVPYGGISYNRKDFYKKINYISSKELHEYTKNTHIYNEDFEDFLKNIKPEKNDFIFIDPPYDTEFSTYAKNAFDKKDQIRLANTLNNTKANIMIIIKNTDFIYDLYNSKGFNIKSFDKKYLVSFQNRNEKDVEHLIITNY